MSRRYSAHFPWDSKCQLCGIQYMDVHSSQRRIRHGKRIKIGMGLFSFSTKSPIATISLSLLPLWCLLFPLVFLPLICASLLFSNFHIFFSFLLVFSFPLSSQFFLNLIPLALSHIMKSKEPGMVCGSVSADPSPQGPSQGLQDFSKASWQCPLFYGHSIWTLTGLCQCSWTGRGEIYDGTDHSAKINCPSSARGIGVCKCQHLIHKLKDRAEGARLAVQDLNMARL